MKPVASRGARAAVSRVVRVLIIVGALLQPSVELAPADAPGSLIRPSLAPPIAVGARPLLPPLRVAVPESLCPCSCWVMLPRIAVDRHRHIAIGRPCA